MSNKFYINYFLLLSVFFSGSVVAGWLQEPGRLLKETVTGEKDHVGGAVADVASGAVDAASRVVQPDTPNTLGYNPSVGTAPPASSNDVPPVSTGVDQSEINKMREELKQLKQQKLEQEREIEEQRLREEAEMRQREQEAEQKKQEEAQREAQAELKQEKARAAQEEKERQEQAVLAREEENQRRLDEINRKHELKMKAINDLGSLFKALVDERAKR